MDARDWIAVNVAPESLLGVWSIQCIAFAHLPYRYRFGGASCIKMVNPFANLFQSCLMPFVRRQMGEISEHTIMSLRRLAIGYFCNPRSSIRYFRRAKTQELANSD